MPSNKTSKKFADRLLDLLADTKKGGKDLATVAKEIGISAGALSNYQNDKAEIKIDALSKIADYFNVSCDYLLGKIETKFPENYEAGDELGLSDKSIEQLKLLHQADASWIINSLFNNGLKDILHEANTMYGRKLWIKEAFGEPLYYIENEEQPMGELVPDSIFVENNLDRELEYLRKNGEFVSFVLDSRGVVMDGVLNIRMEANQYLSWRISVVGDKLKEALIELMIDDDEE